MPEPALTTVALTGDATAVLQAVPARAGVGQLLGPAGKSLVIGRPANLRRWMGSHLGLARIKPGARPPIDLRPVAVAARYTLATSPFHQRLAFERLMSAYVPRSSRRDLKRPSWIHLDPEERFPRLSLRAAAAGRRQHLFGPFRERAAAARALDALHKRLPLRPCDFTFEPDPALPLGLNCLFAQVRSCAAPCLQRVGEADYRSLAEEARRLLSRPWERPAELFGVLPDWVATEEGSRAIVVEPGRDALELYPVLEGAVVEESATRASLEELEPALAATTWTPPPEPRDDEPWLLAWLPARRTGSYVVLAPGEPPAALAVRVREALAKGAVPRVGQPTRIEPSA